MLFHLPIGPAGSSTRSWSVRKRGPGCIRSFPPLDGRGSSPNRRQVQGRIVRQPDRDLVAQSALAESRVALGGPWRRNPSCCWPIGGVPPAHVVASQPDCGGADDKLLVRPFGSDLLPDIDVRLPHRLVAAGDQDHIGRSRVHVLTRCRSRSRYSVPSQMRRSPLLPLYGFR